MDGRYELIQRSLHRLNTTLLTAEEQAKLLRIIASTANQLAAELMVEHSETGK